MGVEKKRVPSVAAHVAAFEMMESLTRLVVYNTRRTVVRGGIMVRELPW